MGCPVCQSDSISRNLHQIQYSGKTFCISSCRNCNLWFYDPFPTPDYKEGLNSEISLRHYLETCAGIEILVTIAENFFSNYTTGGKKGLEIGCGFGFISHYLECMHGQKMMAYEPSEYGVKGKKMLGLTIIKDFFKSNGNDIYDFCISTEVIEHIEDPVAFAGDIRKSLAEDGRLLLSTPNKDAINLDKMEPVDIALLSPGMHTVLFSEKSLEKMLLLAGFRHVLIKKNGATLYAIASQSPLKDKDLFSTDYNKLINYYQHIYQMSPPGSPLYKGIFYRLLGINVNFGLYQDAINLIKNNPDFFVLTEEGVLDIRSEDDLTVFYCLSDSIIYFYCGILYLNYMSNFEKAANLFLLSFLSCEKRLSLIPHFAITDAEIIWQAKLHQGIALQRLESFTQAAHCYIEILSFKKSVGNIPVARDPVRSEARTRLNQIIESL
jgi:2-polyprenyl-3-methyl-5-hydroxy-6-metoxy-1,4-benzoquinol methylase